jgi:hypothetical protein
MHCVVKYRFSDVKVCGLRENRCVVTCGMAAMSLTAQFHLTATKIILMLRNFDKHSLRHDFRVGLQREM